MEKRIAKDVAATEEGPPAAMHAGAILAAEKWVATLLPGLSKDVALADDATAPKKDDIKKEAADLTTRGREDTSFSIEMKEHASVSASSIASTSLHNYHSHRHTNIT